MKIIILGAGQVGSSLAKSLQKDHSVSIIDERAARLRQIQNHFDVRTVCGSASHPNILEEAGANDADMIIAVTNNDEVNIVACQIAYSLFKIPTKIARLRNKNYARYPQIFNNDNIPIDFIINPAELVTQRLVRLVEHPGSFQVVDFINSRVQLVGSSISSDSPLHGMAIREFRQELSDIDARIMAVYRQKQNITVTADTVLQAHDDVFFIAEKINVPAILEEFQPNQTKFRKIFIAGGGHIGLGLAKRLENDYLVKIVEHNYDVCHLAAESLNNATVLAGDASDAELLNTESIDDTDLFCAVTNDDEANIMSAMLAKKMGAKSTIALVNSLSYAELVDDTYTIDRAISPQRITIGAIQTYLRKGDMVNIYSLYAGQAEAIEIVVHGSKDSSPIVGKTISELNLPKSVSIGAIMRDNQIMIAHDHYTLESGDTVVVIVTDMEYIPNVEKMFQVLPIFL
ncbi:Trk system potassium transporter TrkA [Facilibium subflavum]|uniref:Trk system potassium transporter TrkA n=1 Tax=Facilibium subflavum TaxID=2219058 RepID=UPI000E654FE1|nr:Trk system potassium transporter TrkA [Facilibium subflavum]